MPRLGPTGTSRDGPRNVGRGGSAPSRGPVRVTTPDIHPQFCNGSGTRCVILALPVNRRLGEVHAAEEGLEAGIARIGSKGTQNCQPPTQVSLRQRIAGGYVRRRSERLHRFFTPAETS